ncbi:developmental pluripotency-associated protein 3-like [Rattus norvegicus]|uniref:developmental pluripotency-associated protein 3-like n=1 Tax=Rattus norvegicus TaxID=10116 RepID=UPI00001C7464|nr:developmental pluripotency-associated protein 3-like [Rattus norvegicus]
MDEPSQKVDPVVYPETQMIDLRGKVERTHPNDSETLQPETLVKVMKKLTLNPSAKWPKYHRHHSLRHRVQNQPVENRSERIMREVQSAFPKRRVHTLLSSVLKEPVARMRRFVRIEQRQRQLEGNENRDEPFRCLCTFCHYQRWDPSENAKIGQNQKN